MIPYGDFQKNPPVESITILIIHKNQSEVRICLLNKSVSKRKMADMKKIKSGFLVVLYIRIVIDCTEKF